jgi:hypothetical protein
MIALTRQLLVLLRGLIEQLIASLSRAPKRLILNLDVTDDAVPG